MIASDIPRLVVRKSLKNISAQLIKYNPPGDKILITTTTKELQKNYGLKGSRRNTTSAYLVGYLIGKKAIKDNIKKAICDVGMQSLVKGSIIFSCLKGAVDAGLDIPYSEDVLPSKDRMLGKHLKNPIPLEEIKKKIDLGVKK